VFSAKDLLFTPPAAVTAQPSFDAVGAGKTGTATTLTWSHTITGNAVIVGGNILEHTSTSPTLTAKVGSTSMTSIAKLSPILSTATGWYFTVFAFQLLNPPTGAQTMTLTLTGTSPDTAVNSVSYSNVSSVGTPTQDSHTTATTSASTTVSSASNQTVVYVYGNGTTGTLSAFNQTQRYYQPYVASTCNPALIGDAPGAASVTFSLTQSASGNYGAIGVPLS
jgi:hypothetical protein